MSPQRGGWWPESCLTLLVQAALVAAAVTVACLSALLSLFYLAGVAS